MAGGADASGASGGGNDPLGITPLSRPFDVSIRPPGSKSVTNRALLLAALARGRSELRGALVDADDAVRMIGALRSLGAVVEIGDGVVSIEGVDGRWRADEGVTLNLGNAGTAMRFLAASAVLADAPVTLDGNARMRERPIGELVEVLRELGADVRYGGGEGYPPITVSAPAAGGAVASELEMGRTKSGQFISAVLMLGAGLERGLTLTLTASPTSESYVRMTLEMLSRVGAFVRTSADMRVVRVGPASQGGASGARAFDGFEMEIEPDASGATYFWGAAALVRGARCEIRGLGPSPMQADAKFCNVLARMGVATRGASDEDDGIVCEGTGRILPVLADMSQMPDAAVTLAVVCAFAEGPSVLRGVRTLRVKECDRIDALRTELAKIGVTVEADVAGDADAMTIVPPEDGVDCSEGVSRVEFETYDDHRMAMALALVGLRRPNVWIRDPGCVGKTYPGFWGEFGRLRESPRKRRAGRS